MASLAIQTPALPCCLRRVPTVRYGFAPGDKSTHAAACLFLAALPAPPVQAVLISSALLNPLYLLRASIISLATAIIPDA